MFLEGGSIALVFIAISKDFLLEISLSKKYSIAYLSNLSGEQASYIFGYHLVKCRSILKLFVCTYFINFFKDCIFKLCGNPPGFSH